MILPSITCRSLSSCANLFPSSLVVCYEADGPTLSPERVCCPMFNDPCHGVLRQNRRERSGGGWWDVVGETGHFGCPVLTAAIKTHISRSQCFPVFFFFFPLRFLGSSIPSSMCTPVTPDVVKPDFLSWHLSPLFIRTGANTAKFGVIVQV